MAASAAIARLRGRDAPAASDSSPPDELLCPITQTLMRDPIVLTSGHAVDLEALLQFWRTCPFAMANPVTREPMKTLEDANLIPGLQLRSAIDAYLVRLPPGVVPDGWPSREPGPRSTREALKAVSARLYQIGTSASVVRIAGTLPPTATASASACLGVYERDGTLIHERPSYTSRDGARALWFSASKSDGSPNNFWHAAEVAFKGSAGGHLGIDAELELSTAFRGLPWPSTAFCWPQPSTYIPRPPTASLGLPLALGGLSLAFHGLPLTFHDLP